jgi:hypothetical protein
MSPRSSHVPQRPDVIEARFPALPVGRLGDTTLRNIVTCGLVHFRTGPWVALREDGSRVLRIIEGAEPPLFAAAPRERPTPTPSPPEPPVAADAEPSLFADRPRAWGAQTRPPSTPSRTVVLSPASLGGSRPRRHAAPRRHRPPRP